MNKNEVSTFIDEMEQLGDEWEAEDVERVYGDMDLQDALDARRGDLSAFGNILSLVLNR